MAKSGPKRDRKIAVWRRDGFRCRYCGRPVETPSPGIPAYLWATVDHKTPLSRGGSNRTHNLVTCCMACNKRKANKDHKAFVESGKAALSYNGGFRSLAQLHRDRGSKPDGGDALAAPSRSDESPGAR